MKPRRLLLFGETEPLSEACARPARARAAGGRPLRRRARL